MRVRVLVLMLAFAAASPAQAADEALLSCVDRRVSEETLDDMMASVIFDDNWTELLNESPPEDVEAIILACEDANFLPAAARKAYFDFSLNRLIRRGSGQTLLGGGVKPEEVDRALGLGLGRANPIVAEITTAARADEMDSALESAVIASGTTVSALLRVHITALMAYTEASARMFRAQARLP